MRRYLEALEAHKPKRGRKRSPESIDKRLKKIEELLVDADPLQRLQLVQERMNLQAERARGRVEDRPPATAEGASSKAAGRTRSARASPTPPGVSSASNPPSSPKPASSEAADRPTLRRAAARPGDRPSRADGRQADTVADASSERRSGRPSAEPSRSLMARSGCGISPTTLRPALLMPAMSSTDPFGLST